MSSLEQFLLDASLRAAAILACAWILSRGLVFCRSSAALRHRLWSLSLASALGVPLLIAILPSLRVSVPWPYPGSVATAVELTLTETNQDAGLLAFAAPGEATPVSAVFPTSSRLDVPPTKPVHESIVPPSSRIVATPRVSWLFLAWSIGACLTLVPTCLGIASLWNLSRHSQVVSGGPLFDALQQTVRQLGRDRPVRLLIAADRSMPMTWGIFRHTILLPAAAEKWSRDRLQMVLLHELAHVARRDCLAQILAQLARAAYWFNPLVWIAERSLRIEQEQACDDFVINRGIDGPDYAENLLSVAASCLPACRSTLALAMARSSKLEQRVLGILNPRQNRRPLSPRLARLVCTVAIALTSLISALQLYPEAALAQAPAQKTAAKAGDAIAATDRAQTIAELRSKIAEQYAKPVNENEIMQGAIKGMVESLRDPYSDYLTPEALAQLEKQISGTLVGIGAQLEMHEKQVRVVTPLPGSPALKAGIQPGDVLLEIDGQPTAGIELSEAVKRIIGAAGSNVRLTIGRGAKRKVELNVTRGTINLPSIRAFRAPAVGQPDFLFDKANGIGYIQIDQFGSGVAQETRAAIESLQNAGLKGLILDLRNCPGGLLDSAVGAAKLFLSGKTIVSIHRPGNATEIKAEEPAIAGDIPLVVLVNGQTASAAEVFVGALQDNQRARVLGTRTLGKGSIQTLIKLNGESGAVKLTTSEYRLPSGRSIDKRPGEKSWGIDPDDGFFVPIDHQQAKTMLQRRQERQVIGGRAAADGGRSAPVTAALLEEQESDPQLAAALKALTGRLQTGSFAKINNLTAAQAEQVVHRAEIEQRRQTALEALKKIDDELAQLGQAQPPRN